MNPVSPELKRLVSFVRKAESDKLLQYCFRNSLENEFSTFFVFSKTRRHIKDFRCCRVRNIADYFLFLDLQNFRVSWTKPDNRSCDSFQTMDAGELFI